MNSRALFLTGAAAVALSVAMPAMAQDDLDNQVTTVEGLVITVERREQNLQEVPVAVTAVDDEMRENLGVLTIQDMAQFTPGVSYNTTTDRPTIRGIGRQSNTFSIDSPVANYFDGVYTSSVQDASRRPIFIERTEILRGPQGALSGRGSIAGAINTISKRPRDYYEAEIGLLARNYSGYGIEATATGPILPWVRGRLNVGRYFQNDGYFSNVAFRATEGDQPNNRQIYDVILEGDIGENVDFFLKAAFADYDETRRTTASLAPYAVGNSRCGVQTTYSPAYSVTGGGAYEGGLVPTAAIGYFNAVPVGCANAGAPLAIGVVSGDIAGFNDVLGGVTENPVSTNNLRLYNSDMTSSQRLDDHHNYTAQLTWHAPMFDLKYIGGHQNYVYTQFTDADGTAVTQIALPSTLGGYRVVDPSGLSMYQEEREWFSHEINAASVMDGPFQWIAGLYQSFEDYRQEPQTRWYYGYPELNAPTGAPLNADPFRAQYGELFGETRSTAVFGQVDWEPNDLWKFTVGLRYNKDEKNVTEQSRLIYNNDPGLGGGYYNGLYVSSLDLTGSLEPGFVTAPAGADVPTGYTLVDTSSFPVVGGQYILPENAGAVPITSQILLAPGVTGLPTVDADGNRVRNLWGEWSAVTGSIGVDYTPNRDSLYYARFARGYRPGGFNAGFLSETPQVEEESVNSYEVGAKLTLFNALQLNTAAFFYDYTDIQQPLATFERCIDPADLSTCSAVNSFVNLPSAENMGIEIEGTWFATNNLQLTFSYGYLDAAIKDGRTTFGFQDPLDPAALLPTAQRLLPINCAPSPSSPNCILTTPDAVNGTTFATGYYQHDELTNSVQWTQDLSGNPLQNSPRHKVFLNGSYTFDFMPGDLTLSGTYIWRDESYGGLFGAEIDKVPSYSQVNLRAIWRDAMGRYSLIAYVNNVFDEDVAESFFLTRRDASDPLATGAIQAAGATYYPGFDLAPPRTFGVEMFRRF